MAAAEEPESFDIWQPGLWRAFIDGNTDLHGEGQPIFELAAAIYNDLAEAEGIEGRLTERDARDFFTMMSESKY